MKLFQCSCEKRVYGSFGSKKFGKSVAQGIEHFDGCYELLVIRMFYAMDIVVTDDMFEANTI